MRVPRVLFARNHFHECPVNVGRRKGDFPPFSCDNNQKIVTNSLTNTAHHGYSCRPLGFNTSIMDTFVIIKCSFTFLPRPQEDTVVETTFCYSNGFLNENILHDGVCKV